MAVLPNRKLRRGGGGKSGFLCSLDDDDERSALDGEGEGERRPDGDGDGAREPDGVASSSESVSSPCSVVARDATSIPAANTEADVRVCLSPLAMFVSDLLLLLRR